MLTDTLADMLTRIRNAQRIGHRSVKVSKSSLGMAVLSVLKDEGFIELFEVKNDAETSFDYCDVYLKYYSSGQPAMSEIKRMSSPGRRQYVGTEELPKPEGGLGISVVSTSQGVMSDREARKRKIGGELLAVIS